MPTKLRNCRSSRVYAARVSVDDDRVSHAVHASVKRTRTSAVVKLPGPSNAGMSAAVDGTAELWFSPSCCSESLPPIDDRVVSFSGCQWFSEPDFIACKVSFAKYTLGRKCFASRRSIYSRPVMKSGFGKLSGLTTYQYAVFGNSCLVMYGSP